MRSLLSGFYCTIKSKEWTLEDNLSDNEERKVTYDKAETVLEDDVSDTAIAAEEVLDVPLGRAVGQTADVHASSHLYLSSTIPLLLSLILSAPFSFTQMITRTTKRKSNALFLLLRLQKRNGSRLNCTRQFTFA